MRVADYYPRPGEFERLLIDAERRASTNWEEDFTSSLRFRFERHGVEMFLTGKQVEQIERIANK